ncbi:MAG: deoxyribodipyrimidine photo-lyase [Gemmatimonadota bacterium]
MAFIPPARLHPLNEAPVRADGRYVLYWMVTARRLRWNFALDHALGLARSLRVPLLVLEAIRAGYPWASQRHHAFALEGMREHRDRLSGTGVAYHPYVEPEDGAGRGLVETLAAQASAVVTDVFPAFFLPRMQEAVAPRLPVALHGVDGNGLLPLAASPGPFSAAVHFRRFLQKTLPHHILDFPSSDPFQEGLPPAGSLPEAVRERWPAASDALLRSDPDALAVLPVDARVGASGIPGGEAAARRRLGAFLADGLDRYGEERNHPDAEATSGLSPYLHWGHLSVHEVFHALALREEWSPARLAPRADGKRHGWWGFAPPVESFLDELVTWRELGFGYCHHVPDHHRYETLPRWALETLEAHADDPREAVYSLEEFDEARTHDPLWNAAQRELRERGVVHNYMRMLWGKKILEWSRHPREALDIMIELNNRYALDGRDPNSWTGIAWVLGRFDRGWPERPVYGKVRSMSSPATRRKVRLDRYLERWGPQGGLDL